MLIHHYSNTYRTDHKQLNIYLRALEKTSQAHGINVLTLDKTEVKRSLARAYNAIL